MSKTKPGNVMLHFTKPDENGARQLTVRQGRKPLDPNGEKMKVRHVRATDAQWAKFHALGGITAFRAWLDSQ